MIKFEKVSFEQFKKDYIKAKGYSDEYVMNWSDEISTKAKHLYNKIKLPERATVGSAGYDFYAPYDFTILPDQTITLPSGIRCTMNDDVFLSIHPRSGLGFKWGMRLCNTTGIIDSDYYNSDNEGHIMFKFATDVDYACSIKQGQGMVQGIFMKYLKTNDDEVIGSRNGGFGSTDTTN